MHGVVYAHIEMQQPIKAFQQVVAICEAGYSPVSRIMETVATELCREVCMLSITPCPAIYHPMETVSTELSACQ